MTNDMTVGKPFRVILRMSIPILAGNLLQQFYAMADTVIVGRYLGRNALAAVGSTTSLYFLILWFVADMVNGFAVIIAQRFGAGDYKGMREKIGLAVILAVSITVFLSVVSNLAVRSLLAVMQTPDEIMEDACSYIRVIFGGLLATILYNMSAAILRALGDGKTPLYFLAVSSALNIILDVLFIRSFHLGAAGAAYATVIAQAVSGILCVWYMYRKFPILHLERSDFRFRWKPALEMLQMGVPMGLMGAMTAIGIIILQFAINSFGAASMAAYTAATKVEQFVCMPLTAYSVTMANFVGQNYGAGKFDNIRKGIRQCFLLMLITSALMCVITLLFGNFFVGLFLDEADAEVLGYAAQYVRVIAFFLPVFGTICLLRKCMQGVGDARIPMINGIVETVSRILWTVWLIRYGDFYMLTWANASTWMAAVIILCIFYKRKMKRLVK